MRCSVSGEHAASLFLIGRYFSSEIFFKFFRNVLTYRHRFHDTRHNTAGIGVVSVVRPLIPLSETFTVMEVHRLS